MYLKFGRRPVMVGTLCVYVAALAGCSAAQTYPQLMALRVLQSFGSGVCEALPVQLVNEIVFSFPYITLLAFHKSNLTFLLVLPSRTSQSPRFLHRRPLSR